MTENEAIEALTELRGYGSNKFASIGFGRKEALGMAIKALEQTRWIPCAERLPEDGDTYLVTIEYNGEVIGVDAASYSPVDGYIDKHWETFNDWKEDDDSCYHVTAWMPLPEPYKAESEDKG